MNSREWQSLPVDIRETIEDHQLEAPIRLAAIADALGLRLRGATLPAGISGEIRPDPEATNGFLVRVNKHDSPRRQRFTVAHEIAHFLLHRGQIGQGITDDVLYRSGMSDFREAQANRLAADILMPQNLVDQWIKTAEVLGVDDVVGYLADRFDVSEASMRIKLGLA